MNQSLYSKNKGRINSELLSEENKKLKEEIERKKIVSINEKANKPSSKQPEWEVKGVGNDGKGKKGKGRGHKPRKGAGNQKKHREPNRTEKATVDQCYLILLVKFLYVNTD